MAGELLGFVGVGRMGGPMCARLLDAGYTLCVYDRDPNATAPLAARGVRIANSPREVASAAEIVLMSLPTPDIVKAVALGEDGIAHGDRVRTLIDLSTTGPGASTIIARGLSEHNVTFVDAPVSGGIAGAKGGTLAVMVSCPKDVYAPQVEPILKHFGKLFYTGEKPGLAQTAKLVNNLLAAAALVISSEGMVMGVKAGLDPKILLDIINVSSGRNSATQDKFPRSVLTGTFDFGFATALSYKDVRLCLDEAEAMGIPMIMGAIVRQILALTQAKYGPDSDFTSIAKLSEEWAGVQIRG
ncbi:MAG: NAD(P)-dependent oxidoreductase [Rhodopseudomonas sp.]|uniref:NAD(P)-dependent oxidoreductase n=1 Tax=Rhodopseudomonas sp. TaxID=1078 RepID=UPI001809AD94|nr:NAD(P)-dependent oxidoreductase [Rhodopseudomonas sp.]NVN85306.1 NAD(P)-dependent oxidoreductase [Rhodopseudomonas sp.]